MASTSRLSHRAGRAVRATTRKFCAAYRPVGASKLRLLCSKDFFDSATPAVDDEDEDKDAGGMRT